MTATEVNQKHLGVTGQRSLGRDNPIKRGLATSIKMSSDANLGTPCYYLPVGGFDQVKVIAEKDPEAMAMLRAAIPGFDDVQARDELHFDPAYDVEYKRFVDSVTLLSRLVLVSIHQRPGAPKPAVVLPAWAQSLEEVMHHLAAWNAGEAWAKEVLGADLSQWPATSDECKAKLDANRIQPPPRPTEPAAVQEKEAQPVSEIPFEPTKTDELAEELDETFGPKRVIWTADTSKPGQSQNIAAWKHFEREVWAIDEGLVPPKELKIALAPYGDIPTAIEVLGWPATRAKLQARIDYLKAHKSTQVDAEENTVTDNAGLASTALTAKDWADFLKGKCKSADMLKALGLNKLSEWHGTLEDAYTIYLTRTTPVVPPDEDNYPDEGAHHDEQSAAEANEAEYAHSNPPTTDDDPEPPAALAPATAKHNEPAKASAGNPFKPATFDATWLRMALVGPSGSGKTYTALNIATNLVPNGKVALIDTERGSASKYAKLFKFDVLELRNYHPDTYVKAVKAAVDYGYNVLVIDSLTHAWNADGGILSIVDKKGGGFDKWKDVNPILWRLINTILDAQIHVISTMRVKTDYIMELNERTGKQTPKKVGLAPVMKSEIEYEFDVYGEIELDSTLTISKSRCPALNAAVYPKAGEEVAGALRTWLMGN